MTNLNWVQRPTRRHYSKDFKTEVVRQCRQPGASVAGIALGHGINANIVHRWMRQHEQIVPTAKPGATFLPVVIDTPTLGPGKEIPAPLPVIRVEVRRGEQTIAVNWPLEGASSCATWLREWLK